MIELQKQQYEDEEIFANLHPLIEKWVRQKFGKFSPPQRYAVLNIHKRENTLISAPTGSGKTLSGFLAILNELLYLSEKGELEDKVYCVYVSPLKALNNDIHKNLQQPLYELEQLAGKELGIRVAVRTGDTTPYERQKMSKNPPHILITTPESLSLVLVAPKFRTKFEDVKWVVVDEIHALAPNKRGVHLSLTLERLQILAGNYTRIGLSATVSPLEEVAKYLVGLENGEYRDCKIVNASFAKELDLKVISPVKNIIGASQHQMQRGLYDLMDQLITQHKTTVVFTNTRSATERVVHNLKTRFPKKYGDNIGAHHSSLSKDIRFDIESKLKDGKMKAVVCSTSLELGIDIGYVDLVILLGSPKSVARALQRVGRSGHKLNAKIKGRFIVMDRDDLLECSVMLKDAVEGKIDRVDIPNNCLDVLAQHIYGEAISDKQYVENVYAMVKRSYCYRELPKDKYMEILSYLAGEYADLEHRYVYAKIWHDKALGMIGKRGKMARAIYGSNIGTIPDESALSVKIGDQKIGFLDEGFLERLKKGDVFVLGGNTYRFNYARGMTVQVTPVPGRVPTVPSWFSQMLPLSYDLSLSIQKFRRYMEDLFKQRRSKEYIMNYINEYLYVNKFAANSIYEYFKEQFLYAEIPSDQKIVIEHYKGFGGKKYVVFHTLFGRRVNDALSRAIAYELSKISKKGVSISISDNGFYVCSEGTEVQAVQAFKKVTPKNIRENLVNAIDSTEVLKRRFRHCAGRSLMILRSYKGKRKLAGRQQVSAMILLSAVKSISDKFPILEEARREVLEDLMDLKNAEKVLKGVANGKIKLKSINTDIPSPFALNLVARGFMDVIKLEDRLEFIRRMHEAVLHKIEHLDPEAKRGTLTRLKNTLFGK